MKPFFLFLQKKYLKITVKSKYQEILKVLRKNHDERESQNIAKIYFEDRYGIKNPDSKIFPKNFEKLFHNDLRRFSNNEPVQYITEKAFFYNDFFKVDKSVLIPRPETELLVDLAINSIPNTETLKILDIGTGSGCIALSIAKKKPICSIIGIDISPAALNIAKQNKKLLNIDNVDFLKIDFLNLYQRKTLEKFDIIISNPPYIDKDEKHLMSLNTLKHEPESALFPESENILIFYEKIIEFAKTHLKPSGIAFCEINEHKEEDTMNLCKSAGFKNEIFYDLQDKPRVIKFWKY